MTLNDDWLHFRRDPATSSIDTKVYILLSNDGFAFEEEDVAPEAAAAQPAVYRATLTGEPAEVHVWVPLTIGAGQISPTASFFQEDGTHVRDTHAAAPGQGVDLQPAAMNLNNDGKRLIGPFPLNVEHLINSGVNAHHFKLNLAKIHYWKETVEIRNSGASADTLLMKVNIEGGLREVTKILLPPKDEPAEPVPQQDVMDYMVGPSHVIEQPNFQYTQS